MKNIRMVDEAFLLARINKLGRGDVPSREEFNALVERVNGSFLIAEYGVTPAEDIISYIEAEGDFAPVLIKRGNDLYTGLLVSKKNDNSVYLRAIGSGSGKYYIFDYTIVESTWASKSYGLQELLESGVNIKTINGESVLGPGNIDVHGEGGEIAFITYGESTLADVETAISNNQFIVLIDIEQTDIYLTPVSVTGGAEAYSFVCMIGSDVATYTVDGNGWDMSIAPITDVPEYSYDYDTQVGYFNDGVGTYPIYRKIVNFGELTNATQKTVVHGLAEGFVPIHISGVARKNDGTQNLPLPCVTGTLENMIYLAVGPNRITVTPNSDRSAFTAIVTIDYYVPTA